MRDGDDVGQLQADQSGCRDRAGAPALWRAPCVASVGELRGPCPLPTHTSRRSRDSFSVQPGAQCLVLSIAVLHAGAGWEGWWQHPRSRRADRGLFAARRGAPAPGLERDAAPRNARAGRRTAPPVANAPLHFTLRTSSGITRIWSDRGLTLRTRFARLAWASTAATAFCVVGS